MSVGRSHRRVVVISDRIDWSDEPAGPDEAPWRCLSAGERAAPVAVEGGYLERLPLALIAAGRFDQAEIWHHVRHPHRAVGQRVSPRLTRRGFHLDDPAPPFANAAMVRHFREHGPPDLLVVYGLGVSAEVLAAAQGATILYNSIDAPALRVPPEVSARFDLVLTGAQWQSDEVAQRHPGMATLILPVGPEFAGPDQFRPLGCEKRYDLIYVGAAQDYKRHDILFDAVARLDGRVNALCVFGYGERAEEYRDSCAARGLPIDFVMPPVLPFDEVNRLMNESRIGVVAGVADGAPAILTEYMLAGLPVLANAELCCGRQYITPLTGRLAAADEFAQTIVDMLDVHDMFRPREEALATCLWPLSVRKLMAALDRCAGRSLADRPPVEVLSC